MRKKYLWLYIVVALIVLGILYCWIVPAIWPQYVAVHVSTGDVYFGKLVKFPRMGLKDAWYMQKEDSGALSLLPFSKVVWEPEGDMYFNQHQVVWVAPVRKGTSLYMTLVNGGVVTQTSPINQYQQPSQQQPFQESLIPLEQSPVISPEVSQETFPRGQ